MIKRLKTDIFIHKINKDGKPSKRGTEFGTKPRGWVRNSKKIITLKMTGWLPVETG